MRDINFFEQYTKKKDRKLDKKIIFFALGSLIVIIFATYSVFNAIKIRQETNAVNALRATTEDPKTLERVEAIKAKENEVRKFRESVGKIKTLDESIMERDIIGEELLGIISRRMPENMVLTYLKVANPLIEMSGVAQDKWIVAEFTKGLEDIPNVESIFVSNITTEDAYYSFDLTITLEDVIDDVEEEGQEGQEDSDESETEGDQTEGEE